MIRCNDTSKSIFSMEIVKCVNKEVFANDSLQEFPFSLLLIEQKQCKHQREILKIRKIRKIRKKLRKNYKENSNFRALVRAIKKMLARSTLFFSSSTCLSSKTLPLLTNQLNSM